VANTRHRVVIIGLAVAVVLAITPASVFAHNPETRDGEVISDGANEVGSVFINSQGRVQVNFDNRNDCPTYVSSCWVEVRYLSKCDEFWCWNFDARSDWIRVPFGQDYHSFCGANDWQQWKVEMRLRWQAQTTKTVGYYGEYENVTEIGGSLVYRLMARFMFNFTNGYGYRHGTWMETTTALTDASESTVVATSGNGWLRPSC
jgi:hypothetical protein